MERFPSESSPDKIDPDSGKPKMGRRQFLKFLAAGAGVAGAGGLAQAAEGRPQNETVQSGLQIIDGRIVLWHFDERGHANTYDVIGSSRAKDTEIMRSKEVVDAAKELLELRRRCHEQNESCPEVPLASGRLDIAIRLHGRPPPLPGTPRNPHSPRQSRH